MNNIHDLILFPVVDWRSAIHQVCVVDGEGNVLGERAFEHGSIQRQRYWEPGDRLNGADFA